MSDIVQLELFTQFDYNKDRLLLDRELAGTGIRLKIITNEDIKIRYGLGYMYENEEYDLPAISIHGRNTSANRISSYVTFDISIQNNLSFFSVTYFQPDITKFNDYKFSKHYHQCTFGD